MLRSPDYLAGYSAGYKAGESRATRRFNPQQPKPPAYAKYKFNTLAVGQSKSVPEKKARRVYDAARRWAHRHAPSRRFAVRPAEAGTTITRTA